MRSPRLQSLLEIRFVLRARGNFARKALTSCKEGYHLAKFYELQVTSKESNEIIIPWSLKNGEKDYCEYDNYFVIIAVQMFQFLRTLLI